MRLDETHDPALRSWVDAANDESNDFPVQNLPFGRFRRDAAEPWRLGVAIGDRVLDLAAAGLVNHADMNRLMAEGPAYRRALRSALSLGLRHGSHERSRFAEALVAADQVELGVPCTIGDYTDFYTGIHHATTVGSLFRPDNPLLPNYKWVPIGYHGRGSSIVASGTPFRRPLGQLKAADAEAPVLAPSARLDYELELGVWVGGGNALGEPVDITRAEDQVFGLGLLNDWSSRDVQAWEYQPLGPFLSKSFATTVSPWIVTLEALAPFRAPFARPAGDPQPLPYLDAPAVREAGMFDIQLEVWLQTAAMREAGRAPERLSVSNFRDAYWAVAQLVAHHTVNGCNLAAGDLLGSGTISGPAPEQGGSLLELTKGGKQPVTLASGEQRRFLEDGDTVFLKAFCERPGARRIGFGECHGTVLPARA
ncbi:MAG: fumarylacetoacetase [Piscinibacter sp.]|uniref:fumarylacetoacetase n=1 Tax=Piscinibacter sp. TaxID=1903157 RepID=UPI00258E508A|nr:fumarylacetoacetase [Piscinibacter sp.]MCW5664158.1 fumarylacetoacetase [Piscinibacter sp.]